LCCTFTAIRDIDDVFPRRSSGSAAHFYQRLCRSIQRLCRSLLSAALPLNPAALPLTFISGSAAQSSAALPLTSWPCSGSAAQSSGSAAHFFLLAALPLTAVLDLSAARPLTWTIDGTAAQPLTFARYVFQRIPDIPNCRLEALRVSSRTGAMAVAFDRLRARIGCCRLALDEHAASDEATLKFASLAQRKSLADLIAHADLNDEQRPIIVDALAKCRFAADDKAPLLELAAGEKAKFKKEAKLSQDYSHFQTYMPDILQDHLIDATKPSSEKQSLCFAFLANLGLRRGDEFTYKKLNSLLIVHSVDAGTISSMSAKSKWLMKNQVRDQFLKYAEKLPKIVTRCDILPASATEFLLQYPDLYKNVLGDSPPCVVKLKMLEVLQLDDSYTCRNQGGSGCVGSAIHYQQASQSTALAIVGAPPGDANNMLGQIGQFAEFMMQGMKQMQEQNFQMMRHFVGGSTRGESSLNDATQQGLDQLVGETPSRNFRKDLPCRRNAFPSLGNGADESASSSRVEKCAGPSRAVERESSNVEERAAPHVEKRAAPSPVEEREAPIVEERHTQSLAIVPVVGIEQTPPSNRATKPSIDTIMKALDSRSKDRAKESAEKRSKDKEEKASIARENAAKLLREAGLGLAVVEAVVTVSAPAAAPLASAPVAGVVCKRRIRCKSAIPDVPKPPEVAGLVWYGEPTYGLEKTRCQVLGRTGFRGRGQSVKFEYKGPPGKANAAAKYSNIAEATAAAKVWLVSERKRQRLD
jgi:hypothetical protein